MNKLFKEAEVLVRKMLLLSAIIAATTVLFGCKFNKPMEEIAIEIHDLTSDEAIRYYCEAWSEKHYGKMNMILSDGMKARKFNYDLGKIIEIISIEPTSTSEWPSKLERFEETAIYKVALGIYRHDSLEYEIITELYLIGKETRDSPWLIYGVTGSD